MIHAVIDTNVLVSAFITKNPDSPTAKVWSALLNCSQRDRYLGMTAAMTQIPVPATKRGDSIELLRFNNSDIEGSGTYVSFLISSLVAFTAAGLFDGLILK